MREFTYTGLPARVRFGRGLVNELPAEADFLKISRALVLATPHQRADAERLAEVLGDKAVGIFDGAAMHTPVHVTEQALAVVKREQVDGLVAVGGGSTTGLGKALAWRTDLPQIVFPTTFAGSEMTPILGQTENQQKTTLRSAKVLPETVLYDVNLAMSLPVNIATVSGLNAMAHAVEALYAPDGNPVIDLVAVEGLAALARALPALVANPEAPEPRSEGLYGAWLCGICLGSVGMALHHKLCHTLGGMFDLPHAETHAILLPHAMRYNAQAAPEAARRVAEALGGSDAATALQELARRIGAPLALRDIGMPEDGVAKAAKAASANPYPNPAPLTEAGIQALLAAAYEGRPA